MRVSVIVPVYNTPRDLRECLRALMAEVGPDDEILVVDDGSTDDSATAASAMGVRVVSLPRNAGPSAARNRGVRETTGDLLLFVDADVVVAPGAVERVARTLAARPEYAAVFGSYDTRPAAPTLVAQFRNLLHHYVHQDGDPEASTFWAGLGAVRRAAFEKVGGFDESAYCRSIEDIELGYRLRAAGYRILLEKGLQGTHRKRWTLASMIRTDLCLRAVPWARLMLTRQAPVDDLNVKAAQRASVGLVGLAMLALAASVLVPRLLLVAAGALAVVAILNRKLYGFLQRERGVAFALACLPLHLVYFLCSGLGFLYVWLTLRLAGNRISDHAHPAGRLRP